MPPVMTCPTIVALPRLTLTMSDSNGAKHPGLGLASAGTGLDFSAASSVVFAELPSEVAVVQQAEDRAHRQGQQLPVNVYFLLGQGTTDDRRYQMQLKVWL